jgi:murein DD-endopeptidase MepM/ murein hydrolase activator NlpD
MRRHPKTGKQQMHWGVDIKVPVGTSVQSTGRGVVLRAGWQNDKNPKEGFGRRVVIDHGRGVYSYYGHLSEISVKKGDSITRGTAIGKSGNTGSSSGPHLHYEERQDKGATHRAPTFNPDAE